MASGSVPTPPPLDPSTAAAGTPPGSAPVSAPTTPAPTTPAAVSTPVPAAASTPTLDAKKREEKIKEIIQGLTALKQMERGNAGSQGLIGDENRDKLNNFSNEVLEKIQKKENTTGSLTDASVTDEDIIKMHELYVASGIKKLEEKRSTVAGTKLENMGLEEQVKEKRKRAREKPPTAADGHKFTVEGPSNREHLRDIMESKWAKLGEDIAGLLLIMLILAAIKSWKDNPIRIEMNQISAELSTGKGLDGDASLKDVRMEVSRDGSTGHQTCSFSEVQRDAAGKVIRDAEGREQTKPLETTDPRVQKIINNYCAKLGLDSPADGVPKPDVALSGSTPASDVSLAAPAASDSSDVRLGVRSNPAAAPGVTLSAPAADPAATPCGPAISVPGT